MTTYRFVEGITGTISEVGTVESTWYYKQVTVASEDEVNYFTASTDEEKALAEGTLGCERITKEEYEQATNG